MDYESARKDIHIGSWDDKKEYLRVLICLMALEYIGFLSPSPIAFFVENFKMAEVSDDYL